MSVKYDQEKVDLTFLPEYFGRALEEVCKVAQMGAEKYSRGGWRTVPDGFRRYEAAGMRHKFLRHQGQSVDQESGLLHLAHEAWNALAILELAREQVDAGVICIPPPANDNERKGGPHEGPNGSMFDYIIDD